MTQALPIPVHLPPGSLLVTAGALPSVSEHRLPRPPCTHSSQAPVGGEVCRAGVDATPGRPEEEGCRSEARGDGGSPGGQCGRGSAGTPMGGGPMSCGWEQGPRRGHCQGGSGGSSPGFLLQVRAFVLTHSGKTPPRPPSPPGQLRNRKGLSWQPRGTAAAPAPGRPSRWALWTSKKTRSRCGSHHTRPHRGRSSKKSGSAGPSGP